MYVYRDPDAFVPVSDRTVCGFHQKHPGVPFAGCACSGYYGLRPATPDEYRANRLSRLRERQRVLSDELEKVNRELNSMGTNDGL